MTNAVNIASLGSPMSADSSGNVGIGTSSPDLKLSIAGGMNLRNSSRAGAFEIDSSGNLWAGTATTAGNIYLETGHTTSGLPSTGTARVTVNQYGLGLGATPSSGTGITFPATQSASSDANTLDDYEEGTWTPSLIGSGTSGTASGSSNGYYVKIGRLVVATFDCNKSLSGGTGNCYMNGLPFTSGGGNFAGTATIGYFASMNFSVTELLAYMDSGQTNVNITYTNGSTTNISYANAASFSGRMIGQVTYTTNA